MTSFYGFRNAEEKTKRAVWNKGRVIPGYDPAVWRYDMCGDVMKFPEHGNENSKFGWEIDHIRPVSKGGTDDLNNLQPLYWKNNRKKGDTYPWKCGQGS